MSSIKENFKSNKEFVQLGIQILGGIVVILNLWLVNKLTPITEDVRVVANKIQAVEKAQEDIKDYSYQVIRNTDAITGVKEDIKDIRDSQLRLENYLFK